MKSEFDLKLNQYYRNSIFDVYQSYNVETWDVDETITQLAYLTHDYFRYYGKFPSKIGKNIINDPLVTEFLDKQKHYILDNYSGSGTTLVEAKISGFDSIGLDINPFAVLASNVKTRNLDINELKIRWDNLCEDIEKGYQSFYMDSTLFDENYLNINTNIEQTRKNLYTEFKDVSKWFDQKVIDDLTILKTTLLKLEKDSYREFFVLGFFAIIRRVSRAYDGEVRPHINKNKKPRDVKQAYFKKINEMIISMSDWNQVTKADVFSESFIGDNSNQVEVEKMISNVNLLIKKKLGLVVSHPPYLNCFDYIPVYKLNFSWGYGFDEVFGLFNYNEIRAMEVKSWPVQSDSHINSYFEHHQKVYSSIYANLIKGGLCCVVIGDCTVTKNLFSVHKSFIKLLEDIGFKIEKVVYRTTNYGLGKYAYNHRADYHGDDEGKKDAIIFFRK